MTLEQRLVDSDTREEILTFAQLDKTVRTQRVYELMIGMNLGLGIEDIAKFRLLGLIVPDKELDSTSDPAFYTAFYELDERKLSRRGEANEYEARILYGEGFFYIQTTLVDWRYELLKSGRWSLQDQRKNLKFLPFELTRVPDVYCTERPNPVEVLRIKDEAVERARIWEKDRYDYEDYLNILMQIGRTNGEARFVEKD